MKRVPLHRVLQLLRNGLRFRYLRRSGRPGRPQAVSLEITHRCVARCVMCNIWRIPNDVPDLGMSTWMGLLSSQYLSDLRELDVTGGEPFLREDLVEFVLAVAGLKQRNLRKLRSVIIKTIKAGAAAATFDQALEKGYEGNAEIACTDAAREGISAFLEKRRPEFKK